MNKKDSSFSIVMTVYDQARSLEEHLPAFLSQEYEPGYEVIVVDESSTDDTDDVLKLLKQAHANLYSTFIPKQRLNATPHKMALSIGIKAAKNEWVILTDINNVPNSDTWLAELADATDKTTDAVIGYFTKKRLRLQSFEEASQTRKLVGKEERKRKKASKGGLLKYRCGRYDFVAVRREKAYEVLKYFEQDIKTPRLLGMRLSVFLHNCFS